MEGTSSVLVDSNFSFFVYTVPQNILLSFGFYILFYFSRQSKISKYIRKFYFLKTTLVIVLLEGNLNYLVFVCFSHLRQAFSFNVADRLSLIFTSLFLFALVHFSLVFYILVFKYLGKNAGLFSDFAYRESASFWHKTSTLMRNFLRGVIFCFLEHHYTTQLIMLSIIEIIMIACSITIQSLHGIFISKTIYRLGVLYSLLLIALNLNLLSEDLVDEDEFLSVKKV